MTWRSLPSLVCRSIWWAAGLVIVFTLGGFFVLPPIAKGQMEKRLGATLGRTVVVGAVRINPYALSATFENFNVREADGKSSFLAWRRLDVNFEALASFTGGKSQRGLLLIVPHTVLLSRE